MFRKGGRPAAARHRRGRRRDRRDGHGAGGDGFEPGAELADRLSFQPATRDGRPVPVRIAFRYDFVPPPPRPVALAPATLAAGAGVGAAADEEVFVNGPGLPSGVTARMLEPTEIVHSPGTNGDALRALQDLPGVGLAPLFIGQILVRGSEVQRTPTCSSTGR